VARRKRSFSTFNLSFLDIMSCGFGAVVLVFLIIDHSIEVESRELNVDLLSEVSLLEEDIRVGRRTWWPCATPSNETDLEIVETQGRATRVSEEVEEYEALVAALVPDGLSEDEAIEQLKAEVQSLEEEVKELRQAAEEQSGKSARSFVGDGNRQYLTGMNLGGRNIAILLDVSASMLADKPGEHHPPAQHGRGSCSAAPKVDPRPEHGGLAHGAAARGQRIPGHHLQHAGPHGATRHRGQWLEVADQAQLEKVSRRPARTDPRRRHQPRERLPLPADPVTGAGQHLPDHRRTADAGRGAPRGSKVSGNQRQRLFRQAVRQLPAGVPVNIILAPMEGDPSPPRSSGSWRRPRAAPS
jgi:hypothetical protein